jgi:ABC-2 type transport system ATP-binding protein
VLETAKITDVRNRLTRELPQGWKQRLALGCAMLHNPGIIFLDEPTSGVDPVTRRHFWEFIRTLSAQGITVFVTTHYMDEAVNCERIAMINLGNIVAEGSPEKIVGDACPGMPQATLNDAFIRLMDGEK